MRLFFEGLFLAIFVHSCCANLSKLSESGSLDLDIDLERLQNGQQTERPKRFIQSCDEAGTSGVYELRLSSKSEPFRAFCDVESLYGKWLVFQQRLDGSVDFNRSWAEYRDGFGTIGESTEYWLGLELIYQITASGNFELAIELKNEAGKYGFARYDAFRVSEETYHYAIVRLGSFRGTIHENLCGKFGTYDRNTYSDQQNLGGWWFLYSCDKSFLNGQFMPNPKTGKGIYWDGWTQAATFSRMMLRRKTFKN